MSVEAVANSEAECCGRHDAPSASPGDFRFASCGPYLCRLRNFKLATIDEFMGRGGMLTVVAERSMRRGRASSAVSSSDRPRPVSLA